MLSKLEKIIKVDLSYVVKGGFWLTLGNGISFLSSLVLGIAFANLLPKATYGNYNFVISITNLLVLFSLNGMNTAITRAVAREKFGTIKKVIFTRIRWGIIGSIISFLLAVYYYSSGNLILAISLFFASFAIPFLDSLGIYDFILQGKKLFKTATIYLTVSQFVVTLILLLTIFINKSPILLIGVYFLSNIFTSLFFLKKTLKDIPVDHNKDTETITYGKHLSIQGLLGSIVTTIDIPLVFFFLGPINTAIYTIALMPAEHIKGIFKNISTLSTPLFAQRKLDDIKKVLRHQSIVFFLLTIVTAISYIIVAPTLFQLFFPVYSQSVFYTQLLAVSFLAFPVFLPVSIMQAQGMTKKLYIYNVLSASSQIILLLILVPLLGVIGAIIAKVVGRLFSSFLGFYLLSQTKPQLH